MAHRPSGSEIQPLRRGCFVILTGLLLWTGSPSPAAAQEAGEATDLAAGDELGLLEVLELALRHDPNIALVQTDLAGAHGNLEIARSLFDPALAADLAAGRDSLAEPRLESLDASAGASVLLRSGLEVSSSIGLSRLAEDGGGDTENTGSLSVTLRQPLLRGRGRAVVTTAEQVAEEELAAAREDLEQQVASRLRAVAGLYWSYLSAAENLDILRDTEDRSRRFLDNTRRLVEADLTPAADLVQLEANLLSRELSRRSGERRLVEARQELGREIGLDSAAILALPLPGDPYPPLDPAAAPGLGQAPAFLELARGHRADLRASRRRLEENRLQLRFLENALKPRLDLIFSPSYSNTTAGSGAGDFFAPFTRDIPGFASTLGLAWRFSPPNRLARGNLEVRQAALSRSELGLRLVEVQIGADLPAALHNVAYSAEQLAKSLEALELFRRALDNEEKKLRAGSSTLIDVLNQQDQLIAARQQVDASRLGLALALLGLRFETGTLIESPSAAGEPARIALSAFLTLPQLSR